MNFSTAAIAAGAKFAASIAGQAFGAFSIGGLTAILINDISLEIFRKRLPGSYREFIAIGVATLAFLTLSPKVLLIAAAIGAVALSVLFIYKGIKDARKAQAIEARGSRLKAPSEGQQLRPMGAAAAAASGPYWPLL